MRNSILTRLIVSLSFILLTAFGGSLYFADKSVREIVEQNQRHLFKEKIDSLVRMLENRAIRLEKTAQPEAYREDFQKAALQIISGTYFSKDNLLLQSYPIIVDGDSKIILHPFIENKESFHKAETFLNSASRLTSEGGYTIIQGKDIWGIFLPFPTWQWQVGYIVKNEEMYKESNRLYSVIFWIMLIGTCTALTLIFFIVYRIIKPLRDLRQVADSLASGDYSRSFSNVFNKNDEVGSLSGSLERMRTVIQERIAELKGINVTLLEEVEARKEADAARLRREEDYQEIFNATSEAIIIFDAENSTILHVNDTMLDMFGYAKEEVVGREIDIVLSEDSVPITGQLRQNLEKTIHGEHCVFEWRISRQDEVNLWVEISLRSSTIGGKHCILAVLRDVGERKLAERDRAKMEEQLRHVQKMEAIGTLAGGIAHDFNNILTPLVGYSEMLMMQLEQESEQQKSAKAIYSASLRARDLVQHILAISRKGDMTLRPVVVQKEVEEAHSLVTASLPKHILIDCDIDQQCDPVMAEPGQVHQIVMNLSMNAYYAMKDNGGNLSIYLQKMVVSKSNSGDDISLKPGDYVKLIVSDTGCGITPEMKKNIFDPYFTTKDIGEGTGLGLSIVHSIIKSIRGHITLESEQGKTVFSVYLPCVRKLMSEQTTPHLEEMQTGNETIMLVDDESYILDLERAILESLGYRVLDFCSSNIALESFQAAPESFDLVVTDMTMPGMSGFNLTRVLKEIRPDIPVVLISGYSDIIDKDEARKIGIYAILTKPIDMVIFSKTLRDALTDRSNFH